MKKILLSKSFLIIASLATLIAAIVFLYPRSYLTTVVQSEYIVDGKVIDPDEIKLRDNLEKQGVKLKIVTQSNPDTEIPDLEYMNEHSNIDFVIEGNYGGKFDQEVLEKFQSIGTIENFPVFFFVKTNSNLKIRKLKDLQGKHLVFWSTPEGRNNFADDQNPTAFSSDTLLKNIFTEIGINNKNTKISNVYPKTIDMNMDWDVLITNQMPDLDDESLHLSKEFKDGKISFLEFDDISGIQKKLPHLQVKTIAASSYDPSKNIPKQDIHYLTTTYSILIRKDLDRNLIFALTQAAKDSFSESTFLSEKNEFPNFQRSEAFEPSESAEEFYKEGKPFLYKYLPQNIASFLTKLLIIFIPIVTIVLPIYEFFPHLYEVYVKHKINHWYHHLDEIENEYVSCDLSHLQDLLIKIEEIEKKIGQLKLPIMHSHHAQNIYIVKEHIQLIKDKILKKISAKLNT